MISSVLQILPGRFSRVKNGANLGARQEGGGAPGGRFFQCPFVPVPDGKIGKNE